MSLFMINRMQFGAFYRATLCVSAVFAVAWCLSVRLSHSCIVSRRLKISSNFFLGPVAPFYSKRRNPISTGYKIHGAGKICNFQLKSPFISETVRDTPMVAMDR